MPASLPAPPRSWFLLKAGQRRFRRGGRALIPSVMALTLFVLAALIAASMGLAQSQQQTPPSSPQAAPSPTTQATGAPQVSNRPKVESRPRVEARPKVEVRQKTETRPRVEARPN